MAHATAVRDPGVERLAAADLFPTTGLPLHLNHPRHEGDTPLHDHDFLEVAVVAAGHGVHRTIHGLRPVAAGDVVVVHPGRWHAWEACRSLRLWNLGLASGLLNRELAWALHDPWLERVLQPAPRDAPARLPAPVLGAVLARIRDLADGSAQRARRLATLLDVLATLAEALPPRTGGETPDVAVARLMAAMAAEPARAWGLEELARTTGWDRSHLVRRFRRAAGAPPLAWLARQRGERAAVLLLTTTLPIAEVGRRVGWSDPNLFSRRFRALFAQSPGDYRRQLPTPAHPPAVSWVAGADDEPSLREPRRAR